MIGSNSALTPVLILPRTVGCGDRVQGMAVNSGSTVMRELVHVSHPEQIPKEASRKQLADTGRMSSKGQVIEGEEPRREWGGGVGDESILDRGLAVVT